MCISKWSPGGDIEQLIDALEEFLKYYKEAGQGVYRDEEKRDVDCTYVERLQGLVENLRN